MSPGGTPSLACVFQLFLGLHIFAWVQNVPPKLEFAYEEEQWDRFYGNESHTDHFKLLHREATTMLIGARNIVYNISVANLTEFRSQRIVWQPSGAHRELCYLKGKSEDDCHNYIRIGAKIADDKVHVCGTNAYKPLCRTYTITEDGTELEKESEGQGWCPYDPSHNSTAIYAEEQLYTATVADFSGVDPLIYREPLRTERSDLKQLNEPNFVSSMTYKDYVLFFFRETAVEYINCGKVIYSRVARVCKHDKGGPHSFGDRWTSFLKSRLNCSVPGDYPFYFNEIQSTSEVVSGRYGSESAHIVYGVFTTPGNSIGGSAICAFNVDTLMDTFEGPFKEQASMNENWLKVPSNKVPKPRPGQCVTDSRTLPDASVNFVKAHSLMDSSVPQFFQYPLLMRISWQYRFTAIAVDPQVKALNGNLYDVMFVGTDDGRVIKAINVGEPTSEPNVRSVVIEELQVCRFGTPVRSLSIVRADGMEDKLLVVSDEMVQTLPLHRCSTAKIDSCWQCIQLQDPYCAWDSRKEECTAHTERAGNKKHLVQNVVRGAHKACPQQGRGHIVSAVANAPLEKEIDGDAKEASPLCPKCASCSPTPCKSADGSVPPPPSVSVIYSADTLSMAVATSVLATLVVGFVAGYLFSRHFRHDNNYTNMPLHSHHQLNRLTEGTLNAEGSSYLAPCANNAKPAINLVLNVPPKNANGKNANSSTDNKPIQKVKKTYI